MRLHSFKSRAVAGASVLALASGVLVGTAFAGGGHDAGNVRAVIELNSAKAPNFGVLDLGKPGQGDRVSSIENLSTEFAQVEGTCTWGSPRFQIEVETAAHTTKNIFVALGDAPNFTCTPGWHDSGNLADDGAVWDTSQLGSGEQYNTAGNAKAEYGDLKVADVILVLDGPANQSFVFANPTVNNHTREANIKG
jgi:hypothetical protein